MKRLVVAACLALAAICASVAEEAGQSDGEKAVELDFETCTKDILTDWLFLEVPHGLEHTGFYSQADQCEDWIDRRNNHTWLYSECYELFGFDKIHESIRETTSGVELKLHERRMRADKICPDVEAKVKRDFDGNWDKVPKDPPGAKAPDVETCAQNYLDKMESYKLPADFGSWSRNKKLNFCEAAIDTSMEKSIRECVMQSPMYRYRLYDYLQVYSEQEDKESYDEIKHGRITCQPILDLEWDWTDELPQSTVARWVQNVSGFLDLLPQFPRFL